MPLARTRSRLGRARPAPMFHLVVCVSVVFTPRSRAPEPAAKSTVQFHDRTTFPNHVSEPTPISEPHFRTTPNFRTNMSEPP